LQLQFSAVEISPVGEQFHPSPYGQITGCMSYFLDIIDTSSNVLQENRKPGFFDGCHRSVMTMD
jgi:hypothetical protein